MQERRLTVEQSKEAPTSQADPFENFCLSPLDRLAISARHHPQLNAIVVPTMLLKMEDNCSTLPGQEELVLVFASFVHDPSLVPILASSLQKSPGTIYDMVGQAYKMPEIQDAVSQIIDTEHQPTPDEESAIKNEYLQWKLQQFLTKEIVDFLPDDLSFLQREIVQKVMQGRHNEDIARDYNYKNKHSIVQHLSEARAIIERQVLFPHGVTPVTSFGDSALESAASRKDGLFAVLFLRQYYTIQKFVDEYYRTHRRAVNEDLLSSGLFLLRDLLNQEVITHRQYDSLVSTKMYQGILTRDGNRVYISEESLRRYLAGEITPHYGAPPPTNEHISLYAFSKGDKNLFRRLLYGARKKKFPFEQTEGGLFAKPEDLKRYLGQD